ncbi:MAG: hypothetical protein WC393_04405, partial [Candidatus Nanoarchaeia archaeon]
NYDNPLINYSNDFKSATSLNELDNLINAKEVYGALENICQEDKVSIESRFITPLMEQITTSYALLKQQINALKSRIYENYAQEIRSNLSSLANKKGQEFIVSFNDIAKKYSEQNMTIYLKQLCKEQVDALLKKYVSETSSLIESFSQVLSYSWNNVNFVEAKSKSTTQSKKNNNAKILTLPEPELRCPTCGKEVYIVSHSEGQRNGDLICIDKYSCGHRSNN